MNKIFSWTISPTHSNKWDRMALTKLGAYIAATVSTQDAGISFAANIFDPTTRSTVSEDFSSLEEAKSFADAKLKTLGF